MRTIPALLATFAVLAGLSERCSAGAGYLIIPETTSPNERYAVGWGVRDQRDLEAYLKSAPDFYDKVEDYIVDLLQRKPLTKLRLAQFWTYPAIGTANHLDLQARWSPSGDTVVVACGGKWEFISLEAFRVDSGKIVASVEFGKELEKEVRAYFAKKFPAKYQRSKGLTIFFSDLQAGPDFTVTADAQVPKSISTADLAESAQVRFSVEEDGEAGLKVKFLGVGASRGDPAAEADRHLNEAYTALRSRLDPSAKAALKKEQISWLSERDAITDQVRLVAFVEARAADLQRRLRSLGGR